MATGSETSTSLGKKPLRQIGGMSHVLSIASDLDFSLSAPLSQGERASARERELAEAAMARGSETTTSLGKKPLRQIGGMSHALSIPSDLGFSVSAPRSQEEIQNLTLSSGEKGDDLIRVLRELTVVQRKTADLQVELQGRKDDKNMAHLTHVSEMGKKIETLARITTILKAVIQNKDCIIAQLQQPYSLDCIPVEAEYQKQFSELLMKAASDYAALTASVVDFHWSQNFKEPPSVWREMLRPIPVALASCTRFFEDMSAMRESFATLQKLRVGQSFPSIPAPTSGDPSQKILGVSDYVTPLSWRNKSSVDDLAIRSRRGQGIEHLEDDNGQFREHHPADGTGSADMSDLVSSMDDQIAKAKEQARSINKILDKVERSKKAADEEKWLDDHEKGGATSMPDREWRREVLCRVEEAMDGFGGPIICSNCDGSISDDSAKQEQEDSDSDGAGNEAEMLRICSLRGLCGLLPLLLILAHIFDSIPITSALIEIESATSAVLYGSAIAVLALVLVLYSRRKRNLPTDSSLRGPPKCPHQLAEAPGREDDLASDPVSSFPLESSPSLGSFTTITMTSRRRVHGTGEGRISIAAPVRRSCRIRDRAMRSQRDLMSSTSPLVQEMGETV